MGEVPRLLAVGKVVHQKERMVTAIRCIKKLDARFHYHGLALAVLPPLPVDGDAVIQYLGLSQHVVPRFVVAPVLKAAVKHEDANGDRKESKNGLRGHCEPRGNRSNKG